MNRLQEELHSGIVCWELSFNNLNKNNNNQIPKRWLWYFLVGVFFLLGPSCCVFKQGFSICAFASSCRSLGRTGVTSKEARVIRLVESTNCEWLRCLHLNIYLVGGWTFNPFEKRCNRQNGFIFPKFRGEDTKYLKPPPRYVCRGYCKLGVPRMHQQPLFNWVGRSAKHEHYLVQWPCW